jgi:Zn-dependent protease
MHLFRFSGINVYLHWSWAIVAIIEMQSRKNAYNSALWNLAEYLSLFAIVLLHEFGHALACRSVGGRADRILLWPLGGIAYVDPPRRPGAFLWSIAAGPLVNVALLPVTFGALYAANRLMPSASENFQHFLYTIFAINLGLLIFNMLPIYPLDGGQIVQSILWYFVGLPRSLTIAAGIGLAGAAGVVILAIVWSDLWLIFIALFAASQSLRGLKNARLLAAAEQSARLYHPRCPACGQTPPTGDHWLCTCGRSFDTFAGGAQCPSCGAVHTMTACPACGHLSSMAAWYTFSARPTGPEHARSAKQPNPGRRKKL